jgi:hypothetical protein
MHRSCHVRVLSPVLCLVLALVPLAAGCEDQKDTPDAAQRKAECRRLEDHIFRITPQPGAEHGQTDPARLAALMAKVPAEDIEQCAAVQDRKVIACMQAAPDVAAVRACIPPGS